MKLLLYCTKAKPYLYDHLGIRRSWDKRFNTEKIKQSGLDELLLNGKIIAECDFEVEEIRFWYKDYEGYSDTHYYTSGLLQEDLLKRSCLRPIDIANYLPKPFFKDKGQIGYAIHIKNLHIFDKPRELSEYLTRAKKINTFEWCGGKDYAWVCENIDKAPQNMMYATDDEDNDYVLISIKPQWLCKILNGEKTIEVRKKVLKEMMK